MSVGQNQNDKTHQQPSPPHITRDRKPAHQQPADSQPLKYGLTTCECCVDDMTASSQDVTGAAVFRATVSDSLCDGGEESAK